MKNILFLIAAIALFSASSAYAQSSDRDHPIPLSAGEFSGSLDNNNQEVFYSFIAGPGELKITVDVKGRSGEQALLNFELLAKNGATEIICCEFAQGNDGGTGRAVKSVKLAKQQTVILHTTNGPIGGGSFNIRITGAATFASVAKSDGVAVSDSNQISVPTTGKLRIELTDGSAQEFDLRRVRRVTVRQ